MFLLGLFFLPGALMAGVFTVTSSDSFGPGSLAQAVSDANSVQGPHQIVFAIPGPGVHQVDLSKGGVVLGSSITIDGYSQPGARANTLSVGDDAVILIQLDGGGPFASQSSGVTINGDNCVVRGLSFTGFSNTIGVGAIAVVSPDPFGRKGNRIEGNFIGLSPDGVTLRGNDLGVFAPSTQLTQDVIGGNLPAARNIISGNRTGVFVQRDWTIAGNYFGTDGSGALRQGYGNDQAILAFNNNLIGTFEADGGNVITGSETGIEVDESNTIRGNLIFFNETGVLVRGHRNSILSNLIYGNSLIDIDLGGDGPTPNDPGDGDTGANNLQNFPVIMSVARNAGQTVVSGGLNSTPSTDFTLQFFANGPSSAPRQRILGTQTGVTTNSSGDVSFQFAFPVATAADEFITATATDPTGNTSEFFPPNGAVELANISTRGNVGTGDNILIGGIILSSGTAERTFLIRALGPSLNIPGSLADPQIDVRAPDGTLVGHNNNWRDLQEQEIIATGAAPTNNQEAALLLPLSGQSYTVHVSGVNGTSGIATVEIYALANTTDAPKEFRNISTRGNVGTGNNVLIGGTIVRGSAVQKLIVRAIGPDLAGLGVPGSLQDPVLELRDASGTLLASNDDWRSAQEQEIIATGLAPQNERDSATVATLLPTSYTAILQGKNGATGIALIEIYKLD